MVDTFQINLEYYPTFCFYRDSVSQSNERQVYIDHNNTNLAFPTMLHPVIKDIYTRYNFYCPISKLFGRPKPGATPIVSESNINFSRMEGLTTVDNSILQKAYQTKQLACVKVAEDRAHYIITKWSGKSGEAGVFPKQLILFLQV